MRSSRFTDAQKAFVVKQGEDGVPFAEACRKAGISQATYFNWKRKHAGLMPPETKRLRELEEECEHGGMLSGFGLWRCEDVFETSHSGQIVRSRPQR